MDDIKRSTNRDTTQRDRGADGAAAVTALETVLRRLVACHGELLRRVRSQRTAFTLGDLHAMRDAAREEAELLQKVRELERQRRELTRRFASGPGQVPGHGVTSGSRSSSHPEPTPRLLDVANTLPQEPPPAPAAAANGAA